jgi:FAD:protein FMN transferase
MDEISRKIPLLGGEIAIVLYDIDQSVSESIFEEIHDEGLRLQKIFNIFDAKSELSLLNKKRKMRVSKELLDLLNLCIPYCELTQGAYDISIGKQIMQRKQGKDIYPVSCSFKDIQIKNSIVELINNDVVIDLGSAAKGYIGDQLINKLNDIGIENVFLDLRGDIITSGNHFEKIEVQHPRNKGQAILAFMAKNKAIATSGDYSQNYGSLDNSHIIGTKDIISATVIADTLAEADILATCIMVCGTDNIMLFSDKNYFIIDKKLNRIISPGFKNETT